MKRRERLYIIRGGGFKRSSHGILASLLAPLYKRNSKSLIKPIEKNKFKFVLQRTSTTILSDKAKANIINSFSSPLKMPKHEVQH